MRLPTESQWSRYAALCARLWPLSASAREAALQALQATGEDDPQVLSLVAVHFALPLDPDRDRTGERLGNFILEERLGAGGMGVVYRAQQHLGPARRPVAVKLIHPALLLAAREEATARFLTELHSLVTLQHEHIARIYDGGIYEDPCTHEQLPFIATELVRGGQPITAYARDYALSWQERLAVFVRVCHAVCYAHEHRIVHRDLKPANILVDSDGRPVVIDFGLAHACDVVLPGAHLMASGTPAYMSPEQVSAAFGAVSEKSDVYALGLILYELLTDQHPYALPDDGLFEQLRQIITEARPPSLRQYNAAYGGELEAIIAAALAKQPADRLPVTVLRSRLERYLTMLPPERVMSTQALHRTGLMTLSNSQQPVGYGQPTSPGQWLRRGFGKRLIVGAGILLTGATILMFLRQPSLPVTTRALPEPAPTVSSSALAYQALEHGNWSQAENAFQRLAQQGESRRQSQGVAGLAAVALARGNTQQASDFASQAEALDSEIVYSHVLRGHILWNQGKIAAARTAYRTAADKPNGLPWQQAVAANRLGRIYAAEGFPGTALQYFDRTINQSPQMALVYVNKGHLLEQLGRRQEALDLYRQAAQMDPHDRLAGALLRQAERQGHRARDTQLAQRVAALIRAHEAGGPPEDAGDAWTSTALTLGFLGVQRLDSLAPQAGEEALLSEIMAQALQGSGRIRLLDQSLLEALLVELQHNAADLADARVALKMGRILGARLLASGRITHDGTADTLSVSLLETATGTITARANVPWASGTFDRSVEQLAGALLQQVRQVYPVQGRILHVSPQGVVLNIGADQGVTADLTLQVFEHEESGAMGRRIGLIVVTVVEARRSQARVLEHNAAGQPGWVVQEVQRP